MENKQNNNNKQTKNNKSKKRKNKIIPNEVQAEYRLN